MVPPRISTAVITRRLPSPIVVAITTVKTRAVVIARAIVVGIRRVARGVIRRGIHVVRTGVVVAAGQPDTEHDTQQQSTKHGGLLKDLQPIQEQLTPVLTVF